ncbi:J domain-containing protein [[Acholeplasma] multilocale]|uniref:J domain-containing protein n=1 Tax=[Acholeplasma] multilocale TaxID=264638 RepID=UPI00055697AC|nr:DnaJ domain-containing protein [[Acholeplasma] multilocale]
MKFFSKNKKPKQNRESSNPVAEAFERNKTIWMYNSKKTIKVPYYDYFEVYGEYPFLSNYNETKVFLNKQKGVSLSDVNLLIQTLDGYEALVINEWKLNSGNLLKSLDKVLLNKTPENIQFLISYYNVLLDAFRKTMIDQFVGVILVAELDFFFNKINGDVRHKTINKAFFDIKKILSEKTNQIISKLYDDVKERENPFKYYQRDESAYNRDHNRHNYGNRNQQSYQERSNQQQYNQQSQNQQQDSFQESFDDITLAYKTLGVEKGTSATDIKKAYRKLALQYHPDKNSSEEAKEMMAKINAAYDLIKKIEKI